MKTGSRAPVRPAQGAGPEPEEFLDAITAINLRRAWVTATGSWVLTLVVFCVNFALVRWTNVTAVGLMDLALGSAMIGIVAVIRRRPRRGRWPRMFIVVYVVIWLATLDAYYFSALTSGTHNAAYVLGIVSTAVFFLLRPAFFLPLAGINHIYYCLQLEWIASHTGRKIAAPLVDGTVSVVLAGIGSWLLYRAARENWLKERIIEERSRALAASNHELREVMAIAAHDLRGPLLNVRNLIALGRREPEVRSAPTLDRVLAESGAACDALARLVSRLVEAHAAEEVAATLRPEAHDLCTRCRAVAGQALATAEQKGQRIRLALPDASAVAQVDPVVLDRVLENLIGNALKFSAAAAVVTVAVLPAEGGRWRIAVSDEGPGVPAEERDRLWQKFHRGSAQPTGGETTTGLGLFIVKTLTEAMGGRVDYSPGAGRGSVFMVELPAV